MVSERMQRQIDRLLDQAEQAVDGADWAAVVDRARAALAIDPGNADARAFLAMAEANGVTSYVQTSEPTGAESPTASAHPTTEQPTSFAGDRYEVRRFLGEGGKKRVFLAHDTRLDRDVAFALIKTEGLDATGRERITREAQAMGRLGTHPHIVTIFEIGEEHGSPYVVNELLGGGDVEGELQLAGGPLPLARTLEIAKGVCRGLAFAHERGIVHRDLKPGNVWLTESGTAKIGDFGLAVSLDRSRLTQHGMMVGTVAYMPPEQALGGEVTPQADLYSLGAMLYELVTGRPPFQADDPTAIISQHINTPPVAPSWYSEHCPPDLEALILKLLAKVPADRPTSANEVLAALEVVDPEARSASHSDSSANPLDRLARGVFVGRERELERLRAAFDEAFAGGGSVVMLVGEPGIGKTRTVQELVTYVRMRSGTALWGAAQESAGAPPYWPWTLVARGYRDQTPEEERRRQYQPYAVDLQRIFPRLRDLFPGLPEPPPVDSEEGQFRLFDALSSLLHGVSAEKPLLIVLDDLHWADRASLQALTHLARELAHSRILIVGTYRDTDLDRTHPLSSTLADLNREQLFTRIPLRGLSPTEIRSYVTDTSGVNPPAALIARIHEETEGNPFFLSEVVNLMTEEGTLSESSSDVAIPEGVREALGRRLDRLSPEANDLLSLAAVLGREFSHDQLVACSGQDDEAVLRLAEEALAARVIQETNEVGGYRFTHALMQETLLGELAAARRVRRHGQIAVALEELYGDQADSHASELARHFIESSVLNREHARSAARYLQLAAAEASAGLAYDAAVDRLAQCDALVTSAPDRLGEDEGLIVLALALALFEGGRTPEAWESLDRAITLLSDRPFELAGAAIQMAIAVATPFLRSRLESWRWLAEALADSETLQACQALAVLAVTDLGPEGEAASRRAAALYDRLPEQDARVPFLLAWRDTQLDGKPYDPAAKLARFATLRPLAQAAGALRRLNAAAYTAALETGELDAADELGREAAAAYRAAGSRMVGWVEQMRARTRWRREGVVPDSPGGVDHLEDPSLLLLKAEIALEAGDVAGAEAALPEALPQPGPLLGLRCRISLAGGDITAARSAFEEYWSAPDGDRDRAFFWRDLASFDDSIVVLGDRPFLEQIAALGAEKDQFRGALWGTGPDYLRGAIALKLGRIDEAERWFNTGLEWASRWKIPTIIGRNLQGLAEVAERRGDHALAMQRLDAAGELFSRHGAKLYLDQVLAKKEILKA